MAIIRWNPLNLHSLIEDDWDFPTLPGITRLGQGLNLYETSEELVAEAALPGVEEEQIDITIDKGIVRITASIQKREEDNSKKRFFMTSLASTFNYSFRIPEGLLQNQEPEAKLNNGILTLKFKKEKPVEPKKVKVISTKQAQAK